MDEIKGNATKQLMAIWKENFVDLKSGRNDENGCLGFITLTHVGYLVLNLIYIYIYIYIYMRV